MKIVRYAAGLFRCFDWIKKDPPPPLPGKTDPPVAETKASGKHQASLSQDDSPPGYKIRWHH